MKKKIIIVGIVLALVSISIVLSIPKEEKQKEEEKLKESNMLSYTIDGEASSEKPSKEGNYIVNKITCEKGSNIVWDNTNWEVSFSKLESTDKCKVEFISKDKSSTDGRIVTIGSGYEGVDSISKSTVDKGTIKFYAKSGYTIKSVSGCNGIIEDNTLIVNNITGNQTCNLEIELPTLYDKILADNPTVVDSRTNFDEIFTSNTANTIYKVNGELTENGKDVYYFAGGETESLRINNWVKFGKDKDGNNLYWRIIRTNEDGSVRLLYAGSSSEDVTSVPTMTNAVINTSTAYNSSHAVVNYSINVSKNTIGVGYMYGTTESLNSNRGIYSNGNYTGTLTSSGIKQTIDSWYAQGLEVQKDSSNNIYDSYISKTAIYCNDRSGEGWNYSGEMYYGAADRLYNNSKTGRQPSYRCGYGSTENYMNTSGSWTTREIGMYSDASNADRFSASTSSSNGVTGGNGKLQYPVALMTADEVSFAGGKITTNNPTGWYYYNAALASATGSTYWWTMSPFRFQNSSQYAYVFGVHGSSDPGKLRYNYVGNSFGVRPVVSLKSCVTVTGSGTVADPYVPGISSTCASSEN